MGRFNRRWMDRGDRLAARGERLAAGRGMRRTWLVVGSGAAVVLLAAGACEVIGTVAHEERTEVTTLDLDGVEGLRVDNDAGSVTVVGDPDATGVTVRAHVSDGLRSSDSSSGRREGVLFIDASCPNVGSDWCSVDYTIDVPDDLPLTIAASGGVTVADTAARVDVSSESSVDLARMGGEVHVEADLGAVTGRDLTARVVEARSDTGRVALTFARPPRAVTAASDLGSVEVVVPDEEGVAYASEATSDQGAVSERIDEAPDSDRTISARSDLGSVTVRYPAG